MNDYVEGLYVKERRLINGRPNGIRGIEQDAGLRKKVKYNKKVEMIADGIERARPAGFCFEGAGEVSSPSHALSSSGGSLAENSYWAVECTP